MPAAVLRASNTAASGTTVAASATLTAGSLVLVVCSAWYTNDSAHSISIAASGITPIDTVEDTENFGGIAGYVAVVPSSGSHTFTATVGADLDGAAIQVYEIADAAYVGHTLYTGTLFTGAAEITRGGFVSGNLAVACWGHHEYGPRSNEFVGREEGGWSALAEQYFDGWDDSANGSCLWTITQQENSDTTAATPGYQTVTFGAQDTYGIFWEFASAVPAVEFTLSGSPSSAAHGRGFVGIVATCAGSPDARRSGGVANELGSVLSAANERSQSGAAEGALVTTTRGSSSQDASGPTQQALAAAQAGSASAEQSGSLVFGAIALGIGAGSSSTETSGVSALVGGAQGAGSSLPSRSGPLANRLHQAFSGSLSGESAGPMRSGIAPELAGATERQASGAQLIQLDLGLSGSGPNDYAGATEVALVALAAPVTSREAAGSLLLALHQALTSTRSTERSGRVQFGVESVGVGSGSPSLEASGALQLTLSAAGPGSGGEASGALGVALAAQAIGNRDVNPSGIVSLTPVTLGAGSLARSTQGPLVLQPGALGHGAGDSRSGHGQAALAADGFGSPSDAISGRIQFDLATVGVGSGSRSLEVSGATVVRLDAAGVSGGAPRSGAGALATGFEAVGTLRRDSSGRIVTVLLPELSAAVPLVDSGGMTVGLSVLVAATPPGEASGELQIYEVLLFGVGAGSPSDQQSGALILSAQSFARRYSLSAGAEHRVRAAVGSLQTRMATGVLRRIALKTGKE